MRVAVLFVLLASGAATAQERELPPAGSELFRGLLHRAGYVPAAMTGPPPRVVIVFGGLTRSDVPPVCQQVLNSGGSVLFANPSSSWLPDCFPGRPLLSFPAQNVPAVRRPLSNGLPVAGVTVEPKAAERLKWDATQDVVTNHPPRWLQPLIGEHPWVGTVVARVGGGGQAFAVGGTGPVARPGKAVVLADDAVLSNQLIAGRFEDDTDTGNLEFAVGLVRWLKPPGDGPIPCLFVEDGQAVTQFDAVDYDRSLLPSLPTPPPPTLSDLLRPEVQAKLADAANEAFDTMQANDKLGGAFTNPRRFGKTMQWLLGVLALLTAVSLLRRARTARKPPDTSPSKPEAARPAGSFGQRREELLRGGDHTAAVREYLIELFRHHGLPLDEYRHPRRMPKVEADAATRRQVATLWKVAYGPDPISYTRWKELEPMIEAVRADAAAGRWRFAGGRA